MNTLHAISPIDGRYRRQVETLASFFSEAALIKYRVKVEIEYFIALCELPLPQLASFDISKYDKLRDIYQSFSDADAGEVKEIEKVTNHDVKAVEYFIKSRFEKLGFSSYKEFIHFGLTSQDINNTAVPCSMKDCHEQVLMPVLLSVVSQIRELAEEWKDIPMLARTHGQPASPSLLGKEMQVFVYRLANQIKYFEQIPFSAKFGGATGNFNAHQVAYPEMDWIGFANTFVYEKLQLQRSLYTTQIENYDNMAAYFDNFRRIGTILIDFSRDMWTYVSMEYFQQKIKEGEVGSSAMPHKVNPIDFENAEGNLGLANALFQHLSEKLPISRLQRDLTDSTVSRNIGVPLAHFLISLKSVEKGIKKLLLNRQALQRDLEANWAVVAEAIQTVLRSIGYPNPYETLKQLTRTNQKVNEQLLAEFIDSLDLEEDVKRRLKAITPHNYVGIYKAEI